MWKSKSDSGPAPILGPAVDRFSTVSSRVWSETAENGPYQTSADETDAGFLPSVVIFTRGSRQVVWQGLHGALCAAVS